MSADGITPLYFSLAGKAAGVIGVSDVVKETSAAAIAQMQTLGLQVVMLTGDNAATARHIGAAVGLTPTMSLQASCPRARKPRSARCKSRAASPWSVTASTTLPP